MTGRCAALVWLVLFAGGCVDLEVPSPSLGGADAPRAPEQEIWGWTTRVSEAGRPRAEVRAGHFKKYAQSDTARLDGGVRVQFFDRQGQPVSYLSAQEAAVDVRTHEMLVFGDVVLVARDSTRLETDSLRWQREDEKITGNGRVTIHRPEGVETGVGFEASSDLKQWTLNRVTTRLSRPDSLGR